MNDRPRILYIAPRYPWPLDRGDRIRGWGLLDQFCAISDVTLVALSESNPTEVDLGPWPDLCERVEVLPHSRFRARARMVAAIPGRLPFQVAYYRSEALDALASRLVRERFDLVFGQLFRVFPIVDRFRGPVRVIDLADSLRLNLTRAIPTKPGLRRIAFREERRRVAAYETDVVRRVDESWVVSEVDRADLLERAPGASIRVVPNGLLDRRGAVGGSRADGRTVIWLGNLTVGHNIDMVRHLVEAIWPLVRRRRPDAELLLVGECAPETRRRFSGAGITAAGFVDDLAPLLARASVAVAPLRYGAGIQNKVLETMAAGLPVVVTPIVNEPLGGMPGESLLVASGPAEFATAVVALLDDPKRARELGAAGRRLVTSRFSWEGAGRRLSELLDAASAARGAGAAPRD